jgi:tetratricopeptide (TPR) repeat protein
MGEPAARAVLVTSPAGVGKSRLRHELVQQIRARGSVEIWIARGELLRAGAPFGMIAPLIRRAAHLFEGEPVEARRHKLLARVARNVAAADRLRVAEFLGEIVGAQFPGDGRAQLQAARQDPRLLDDQMRRAWVDFVRAETAAQPLVMVLEDLHWGDAKSTEYVDTALRLMRDRPLMVLALARPEVHDRLPKLWHERAVQEIRLHELSQRASERLARDVLGERATPGTMARIWERSVGNAFFLEELLRAVAEGQEGELPESVLAVVESRLDTLDIEDRRLLRAASIFGEVFWSGGLAALLPDVPDLGRRLASLEGAEWIVPRPTGRFHGEAEYAFRHALAREAAYGTLTDDDRRLGHRLAGAWLDAAGEGDAVLLAEHYERGGETSKAVRWYLRAAERARAGHAYIDAERLYSKVLEREGEAEKAVCAAAHRGRGHVRYPLERHHEALADFSRAKTIALEEGDAAGHVETLLDEATALDWMDNYKASKERVEEARDLLPGIRSPLLEARVLLGLGRSAHRASCNDLAAALLDQAAAAAEPLSDDGYETLVIALCLLGFILPALGRLEDAVRQLDRTVALCESHGDRLHLVVAIDHRALVWGCLGDKERLIADMERSLALARELGHSATELAGEFNFGEYLLLMGDVAAAQPHIFNALALDRKISGDPGRPVVSLLKARLLLVGGDEAEARAIAVGIQQRRAEALSRGELDTSMAPSEEVICAMVALATGDGVAAAWDELEARSVRFSVGQERIEVIEMRSLAAQRRGRTEEARLHLRRALDLASRIPNAMGARLRRRSHELGLITGA